LYTTAASADPKAVEAAFVALENRGAAMLDRAGVAPARRRFERSVDARYPRQSHELVIPVPPRAVDAAALAEIAVAFHDRHLHTYGHDNRSEPVQIVSVRVTAIGAIAPLVIRDTVARSGTNTIKAKRQVWFRETGVIEAAIYDRQRMPAGLEVAGPVVIESLESTILVPPRWQAKMNEDGFVLLTRPQQGAGRK
jgi:N-methylhydantoinase A